MTKYLVAAFFVFFPQLALADRPDYVHPTCPVSVNGEGTQLRINDVIVLILDEATQVVTDLETGETFTAASELINDGRMLPQWQYRLASMKLAEYGLPSLHDLMEYPKWCAEDYTS